MFFGSDYRLRVCGHKTSVRWITVAKKQVNIRYALIAGAASRPKCGASGGGLLHLARNDVYSVL